jgi:succinyl-CoA synthetase alpha subunit
MAILADRGSRILLQGLDNPLARFQCMEMVKHGTNLVGIVASEEEIQGFAIPGGIAVHDSFRAGKACSGDIALIFAEPLDAKRHILAALAAGIRIVVCFSDGVPYCDAIEACEHADRLGAILLGPNSSGFLSPGIVKAGFYVEEITLPGKVGVVSKSGSLSYAVLAEMKSVGIGVSTVVAIGGDTVRGAGFPEILKHFERDVDTEAVVLLGEVGGNDEELAAAFIATGMSKPVVAFVSGKSMPKGVSLGHAGAIAKDGKGDYKTKVGHLQAAGVCVSRNIGGIVHDLKTLGVK